jgi:hypothetical protein
MKFQQTVALTPALALALSKGEKTLPVGQWVKRPTGVMAQYVGRKDNGVVAFSDAGQGDGFTGRTQRFARARWHGANRHGDVAKLVRTAPSSVDYAALGAFARQAGGAK